LEPYRATRQVRQFEEDFRAGLSVVQPVAATV
jgi:hypothetical protein